LKYSVTLISSKHHCAHTSSIGKATGTPANGQENAMNTNDMMAEIRDANLNYLMLAQQMIRADKACAIYRLGISAEIASLLETLSNSQLLKLASANLMLARFRFDDTAILGMLTSHSKERSLSQTHAAILMAGQPVEEIG
jgi:flagellar transcriptional activator FlhD